MTRPLANGLFLRLSISTEDRVKAFIKFIHSTFFHANGPLLYPVSSNSIPIQPEYQKVNPQDPSKSKNFPGPHTPSTSSLTSNKNTTTTDTATSIFTKNDSSEPIDQKPEYISPVSSTTNEDLKPLLSNNYDSKYFSLYRTDEYRFKLIEFLYLGHALMHAITSGFKGYQYFVNNNASAWTSFTAHGTHFIVRILIITFACCALYFRVASVKNILKCQLLTCFTLNGMLVTIYGGFLTAAHTSLGTSIPVSFVAVDFVFSLQLLFAVNLFYFWMFYLSIGRPVILQSSDIMYPIMDMLISLTIVYLVVMLDNEHLRKHDLLLKATEKAEEAVAKQNLCYSVLSHELRTPIHSILNCTELLLKQTELLPEQRNILSIMETCCQNTSLVINHLLYHSRIQSDHFSHPVTEFSVCSIVESAIETIIPAADAKSIDLILDMTIKDPNLRSCIGDENGLRRVLANLLINSVKYTESGYVELSVEASTPVPRAKAPKRVIETSDGDISHFIPYIFSVKDTGIGMSKKFAEKCFEAYSQEFRTSSKVTVGTGLGMNIVRQWVERCGGEIKLHTKENKGTIVEFKVWLGRGLAKSSYKSPTCQTFGVLSPLMKKSTAQDACDLFDKGMTANIYTNVLVRSLRTLGCSVVHLNPDTSHDKEIDVLLVDENMSLLQQYVLQKRIQFKKVILFSRMSAVAQLRKEMSSFIQSDWPEGNGQIAFVRKPFLVSSLVEKFDSLWDENKILLNLNSPSHSLIPPKKSDFSPLKTSSLPCERSSFFSGMRLQEKLCKKSSSPLSSPTSCVSKGIRVLIVDDDRISKVILGKFLEHSKYLYKTVSNGQQALNLLKSTAYEKCRPFDVIIMDISMPIMDGFTATKKIRRLEQDYGWQPARIIAVTGGLAADKSEQDLREAGFDDYICKPINFKYLLSFFLPARENHNSLAPAVEESSS